MLSPEVGTKWTSRTGRPCGWRCSGRCGWRSTALLSRCPGPSAARCSRCWPSPRAAPCPSTTSWTRCGRRTLRSPVARPCTPTSRGCAPTSVRPAPGCRRAPTATGWTRRRRWTSHRPEPCSRRARADPDGALPLLQQAHALWRGPVLADLTDVAPIAVAVEGCARLHREVTDALVAAAVAAGRAGRRRRPRHRRTRRGPAARARRAGADAGARGDRAGSRRPCGSGGSTAGGWPRRPASTRHRRSASSSATSPERRSRPAPAATRPGRRRGSSAASSRSRPCTGCSPRTGW